MGAGRVLVVDDEPAVLQLVNRVLTASGYEVLPHTSPAEALQRVQTDSPVDVLLTDVVMPEMRGPDLIRSVQQLSPSTVAVMMSAYADATELPPGIAFLKKPFLPADLVAMLEAVTMHVPRTAAPNATE